MNYAPRWFALAILFLLFSFISAEKEFLEGERIHIEATGMVSVLAADTIEGIHAGYHFFLLEVDTMKPTYEVVREDGADLPNFLRLNGKTISIIGYILPLISSDRVIVQEIELVEPESEITQLGFFDDLFGSSSRFYFNGFDGGLFSSQTHYIRFLILGNSDNGYSCPSTQDAVSEVMQNMEDFYELVTNNRIDNFVFVYSGCVHLSYSSYDYSVSRIYYDIHDDAVNKSSSWTYKSDPATTVVFMEKNPEFGWAGLGNVGSSSHTTDMKMWVNGYFDPATDTVKGAEWVVFHEFGHHISLHHSNLIKRQEDDFYADYDEVDYGNGEYRDIGDIMGAYSSSKPGDRTWFSANQQAVMRFASENWMCRLSPLSSGNDQTIRARILANDDVRTKLYLERNVSDDYLADAAYMDYNSYLMRGQLPNCLAVVIPLEPHSGSPKRPELWLEFRAEYDAYGSGEDDRIWHSGYGLKAVFVNDVTEQRSMAAANNIDLTSRRTSSSDDFSDGGRLMPGERWVCPPALCKNGDSIAIKVGTALRRSSNDETLSDVRYVNGVEALPSYITIEVSRSVDSTKYYDDSFGLFSSKYFSRRLHTCAGWMSEMGRIYAKDSRAYHRALAFHSFENPNSSSSRLLDNYTIEMNYFNWTTKYLAHYLSENMMSRDHSFTGSMMNGYLLSKSVTTVPLDDNFEYQIIGNDRTSLKLYKNSDFLESYTMIWPDLPYGITSARSTILGYNIMNRRIRYSPEITINPGDVIVWIRVHSFFTKEYPEKVNYELWTGFGEKLISLDNIEVDNEDDLDLPTGFSYGTPFLLRNDPRRPLPSVVGIQDVVVERVGGEGTDSNEILRLALPNNSMAFTFPASAPRFFTQGTGTPTVGRVGDIPKDYLMFRPHYVHREEDQTIVSVRGVNYGNMFNAVQIECVDMVYSSRGAGSMLDIDFTMDYGRETSSVNDRVYGWVADFIGDIVPSSMSSLSKQVSDRYGVPFSLVSSSIDGNYGYTWTASEVNTRNTLHRDGSAVFSSRVPIEGYMADSASPGITKMCIGISAPSGVTVTVTDVRFLEKKSFFVKDDGDVIDGQITLPFADSIAPLNMNIKSPFHFADSDRVIEEVFEAQPFIDRSIPFSNYMYSTNVYKKSEYIAKAQHDLGIIPENDGENENSSSAITTQKHVDEDGGNPITPKSYAYKSCRVDALKDNFMYPPVKFGVMNFKSPYTLYQSPLSFDLPNEGKDIDDLLVSTEIRLLSSGTVSYVPVVVGDLLTLEPAIIVPDPEPQNPDPPIDPNDGNNDNDPDDNDNNGDHSDNNDNGGEEPVVNPDDDEKKTNNANSNSGSTVKTVLTVVISLIIIALGGFGGWKFYQHQSKKYHSHSSSLGSAPVGDEFATAKHNPWWHYKSFAQFFQKIQKRVQRLIHGKPSKQSQIAELPYDFGTNNLATVHASESNSESTVYKKSTSERSRLSPKRLGSKVVGLIVEQKKNFKNRRESRKQNKNSSISEAQTVFESSMTATRDLDSSFRMSGALPPPPPVPERPLTFVTAPENL